MNYTRQWVEEQHDVSAPAVYEQDGQNVLVNGPLQRSLMWVNKHDQSITPCLTGEVGGRPGMWEAWILAWHMNNFKNYDVYVDIGANSGYYSILAAQEGLITYAVEASATYCQLIAKSAMLNNLSGLITVSNCAVTDRQEWVGLVVPGDLHGGSYVGPASAGDRVWSQTIDALLPRSKYRTLIKMDIEGAEEKAFAGAVEVNERNKPDYILEYTPRAYSDTFFDKMQEYGRVTVVKYDGTEENITKEDANSCEDWITLVIRWQE